jgi:peptide/nickel transport system substrate-binding protein
VAAFIASVLAGAAAIAPGCSSRPSDTTSATTIRPGGDVVVSTRVEPRTFNQFAGRDPTSYAESLLVHSKLVRINHATQEVEPWLAASWTRSDDGLRYTLTLRPNVTFSDGHPFTSDDVVFSFAAAYDEKTDGPLNDAIRVGHKKLEIAAPDPLTVVITFPSPFGPGIRILDNLPIVPRHRLEAALKSGALASAWGVATPPAEIVGLGPFVFAEYVPGQRLVFTRNPRYWRKDANGTPLPYLDRIRMDIVSDQGAELLRLQSGQIDLPSTELPPEDYAPLKSAADAGRVKLLDLGVSYDADSLWFNLKPGALSDGGRAAWLQKEELRRAVSMAIDRELFANTVYLGAGVPVYGPVTPANKKWYSPDAPRTPHDSGGAKALLAAIGLTDRNGDGVLDDARNQPARFTLLTQKGNIGRERGSAVIRDELKKIGLVVDVVPLELGGLIQRILSGSYDAVYFGVNATDTDPAINLDFWLSSGSGHFWSLGSKSPPDWERRVDELMLQNMASADDGERKRAFDEVQKLFGEHLPVIYFVAPRIYVASSSRIMNLTPRLLRPQLLWSADTIAVVH